MRRRSIGKRLAACLLAGAMLLSSLPAAAWADKAGDPVALEKPVLEVAAPESSVSLEKAIRLVKEKLPVPENLDKFSSDYNEYSGKGRWVLRWYTTTPNEINFNVTIDAVTGAIENINYSNWKPPLGRYSGLPKYSRKQCEEMAGAELDRIQPDIADQTVLVPSSRWYPVALGERDYPVTYDFTFRRTVNGIPVFEQGVNVGVNADTGEITRYDSNWISDLGLPEGRQSVDTGQARQIFLEKSGLELVYFAPYTGDFEAPPELKLVYRLKPPGRFYLNAITGEVIDPREMDFYYYDQGMMGGGGDMARSSMAKKEAALTPAEIKAVEETQDLISAERAQELAVKLAGVPDGYTVTGRNLDRRYRVPGGKAWNIQFADEKKTNWISVSMDARTGELFSFYKNTEYGAEDLYNEPEVKFSEAEAQKIALEFIAARQPERSGEIIFRQAELEIGPWIKNGKRSPRNYNFEYARTFNGVVFPDNGFRVRVNSTSGEVTSYDMTWYNASFPEVSGVLGTAAANAKYLAAHPLTLEYNRGYQRWASDKESEYYLIYRLTGDSGITMDAVTGVELDYEGKPVVNAGKPSFSDIAGHPAEQDIMLLAEAGIITGEGVKFRPTDTISGAELLALLVKAYGRQGPVYPMDAKKDPWYKSIVDQAVALGIIENASAIKPEGAVDRLTMARLGINGAGWGKVASLWRIYSLSVLDAGKVPREYRGYAAAALELGVIMAEKGSFNPTRPVTRGEAATFLVRLLKK